ncbi:putative methyltransferase-domain-containing protein [Exophiala viscosa]|uniref:Methyltransferase-domain-containing protein n=1 Tax=Exophiala viscosa TaxID=2486360 RepID=A0AAN6DXQ0_9EURO|nr:putative methyltransferase-domain-containing protein [Exophiala viscosa]KAI1621342.1 putative methyltransferase-domain-containing protein [Exophiala viscosa]
MVHYIRFLRTPQTAVKPKAIDVSAVIAVTTDLGDALYSQDLDLIIAVLEANRPHGVLHTETAKWQAHSRALKLTVSCPGKYRSRPVRLHVTTEETLSTLKSLDVPRILDVWSEIFPLSENQRTEPIVERQLLLPNRSRVRMWEETGDSIARHVWDAGLGFLLYFAQALSTSPPQGVSSFATLFKSSKVKRLRVLELGAGCGTVGVAFAQLVKCDMVLTDLDDAQEILASNIKCASPLAGSTIKAEVLDWAAGLGDSSNANYDVVLVSDCIYNPDSSLYLVEILRQLATRTPNVLILVGFKRRHEADTIFFERMQQTRFEVTESISIPLPHTMTEQDTAAPMAEFYTYTFRPDPPQDD